MNGYICFYDKRRVEIHAPSLYAAKLAAIAHFKAPKMRQHEIAVTLAERVTGEAVVHTAVD